MVLVMPGKAAITCVERLRGESCSFWRYRQRVLYHLAQRAEKMGMTLVPAIDPA